jgi:AcrR family transcriptional regulator
MNHKDLLVLKKPPHRRVNNPEGTKRNIVEVAAQEFADKGFSGARVDTIADQTKTSKRMIYYFFGSKEDLYLAVLEKAYADARAIEAALDLAHQDPETGLRTLVAYTFDYQNAHPGFVRLIMNENILNGAYLKRSKVIQSVNTVVIDTIRDLLRRGRKTSVFRNGIDPVDLHMTISALCIFNVANRATFSTIFKRDMDSAKALAARRDEVVEVVMRYVRRLPRN